MRGGVFTKFIAAAMEDADVTYLSGKFWAEIPSCFGVWAVGESKEEAVVQLQEVLEEWILFKLRDGDEDFPVLGGANLNLNHKWQVEVCLKGGQDDAKADSE